MEWRLTNRKEFMKWIFVINFREYRPAYCSCLASCIQISIMFRYSFFPSWAQFLQWHIRVLYLNIQNVWKRNFCCFMLFFFSMTSTSIPNAIQTNWIALFCSLKITCATWSSPDMSGLIASPTNWSTKVFKMDSSSTFCASVRLDWVKALSWTRSSIQTSKRLPVRTLCQVWNWRHRHTSFKRATSVWSWRSAILLAMETKSTKTIHLKL